MRNASVVAIVLVAACQAAGPIYGPRRAGSLESDRPTEGGVRIATHWSCGDYSVLNDNLTSGDERMTRWTPCWDHDEGDLASTHPDQPPPPAPGGGRVEVNAILELGPDHPRYLAAEAASCKGLAARDIARSPFSHRTAIVEVVPHREGSELHGAHIVFKQVPGLSPAWMRQAIACQQELYAAHKLDAHFATDPSLVEGTTITVTQRDAQIRVLVATATEDAGRIAFERAEELIAGVQATR